MKLWQIPTTGLKHYFNNTEDRNWLKILKRRFIPAGYNIDNVGEGIRFPGLYGDNEDYKKFYYANFDRDKVFCAPRGNISKNGYVVIGLNPGAADESKKLHEPMWIFGNSSNTLHRLLESVGIYPYFTDIIKEPFKHENGKFDNIRTYSMKDTEAFLKPNLELLTREIILLSPQVVILLGAHRRFLIEYKYVKEYFCRTNPELFKHVTFVTIEHPAVHGLTDASRR